MDCRMFVVFTIARCCNRTWRVVRLVFFREGKENEQRRGVTFIGRTY